MQRFDLIFIKIIQITNPIKDFVNFYVIPVLISEAKFYLKYKKTFIVFINIDQKKMKYVNDNLKTVDSFIISNNTNLLFCEIN